MANPNAGDSKSITNIVDYRSNGSNGGLAANYTYRWNTNNERYKEINNNKRITFYNGTTTVNSSDISTFNNRSGSETLGITGSGSISTAIAGSGKSISLGTLELIDGSGLASNYSLTSGTFT